MPTFLRRAYLDAAGVLPTSEEVENFLADTSADKRAKAVDRLMQRDEFVDYWAYKWSDLLLVSSRRLNSTAMWAFYDWIRDSVKQNKPWNQFASEIFLSSGSTRQNGALNYFVLHKDPIDLSENATQAFLGQRITCARCHNHPLEKWTQTQYYEMANLFARVGREERHAWPARTSSSPRPPATSCIRGWRAAAARRRSMRQSIPIDSPVDRRIGLREVAHQPAEPACSRGPS